MQKIFTLYENCSAARFGFSFAEFSELAADVESSHLEELVLARACARGNEAAWQRFMILYRDKLYAAATAMTRDESGARELADSLYADLYGVRTNSDGLRSSKLKSYSGRGSLEGWLRTVLAQEHVNRLRRQQKLVPFDDAIATRATANEPNPDHVPLAAATEAALAQLPPEDRFILAAYYLDERTLSEIGRMLSVHESTISRRLEKITSQLRKRIVARLRAAGFSKHAAAEIMTTDIRDLSLNVRDRLAQERQP